MGIFQEDPLQPSVIVDVTGANSAIVSAAGALKMDGSAVTQPVSGTVDVSTLPASLLVDSVIPNVPGIATFPYVFNGIRWNRAIAMYNGFSETGANVPAMGLTGQLDDTGSIPAIENQWAPVKITPPRALHVNLRNQAGTEVGTATAPVIISPNLSASRTYSACSTTFTPPATPTDMVTITGSATATVKVLKVELFHTQTLGGTNQFFIVKRSTANTAGTSTTRPIVPHDSANAAATGVVRQYSANPTLGTSLGNLSAARITTPAAASAFASQYTWDFTNSGIEQGVVLRGTSQVLSLNFNGAALPGGLTLTVVVTWIEE